MAKTIRWASLVTAVALVAAACGSSDSGGSDKGGPTGKALTIGVYAALAGTLNEPGAQSGLDAAEDYINKVKGGINGRPITFDVCKSDGTPETIVSCTNKFVENKIPVTFDASVAAAAAAVPALTSAGVPIVGAWAGSPAITAAKYGTAFYWNGDAQVALGTLDLMKTTGAKSASLAVIDFPAAHDYFDKLIVPAGKAQGLEITPQYVAQGSINSEVLAARELATKPDAAGVLQLAEADCTGLLKALRTQGFKGTLLPGPCTEFIDDMGAQAEGAALLTRAWVPKTKTYAPADVQKQLDAFETSMKNVGKEADINSIRAVSVFAGLVTLSDVLGDISGDVTAKSVTTQLEGLKDFPAFLQGTITCDGKAWASSPGACSSQVLYVEVQKDGTLKPISDGLKTIAQPAA
ncbi:MAG: ABC transporter substrate-binding protein [Aeromicrobium sp.]